MVTYMEMTAPPPSPPLATEPATIRVSRETLSRHDYLALYCAIGAPLQWDSRLRMPPADLDALLALPSSHCHLLRDDSTAIGLAEFIGVGDQDVELAHFGLVPAAQGRRLGRFLLDRALNAVWALAPERIWLRTDTNDSPAAIPLYRRAGFRPFLTRMETFPD